MVNRRVIGVTLLRGPSTHDDTRQQPVLVTYMLFHNQAQSRPPMSLLFEDTGPLRKRVVWSMHTENSPPLKLTSVCQGVLLV